MTKNFEVHYEDTEQNEKFFSKYAGQGLRYEISAFVAQINGYKSKKIFMTNKESIALSKFMELFLDEKTEKEIIYMEK